MNTPKLAELDALQLRYGGRQDNPEEAVGADECVRILLDDGALVGGLRRGRTGRCRAAAGVDRDALPGGPLKVFQIRYRDSGDRPRTLLVPGAHRRLRDFAPALPWSVTDVTGEPADADLVRASVEAAANKVTALAWRALGHGDPSSG